MSLERRADTEELLLKIARLIEAGRVRIESMVKMLIFRYTFQRRPYCMQRSKGGLQNLRIQASEYEVKH